MSRATYLKIIIAPIFGSASKLTRYQLYCQALLYCFPPYPRETAPLLWARGTYADSKQPSKTGSPSGHWGVAPTAQLSQDTVDAHLPPG